MIFPLTTTEKCVPTHRLIFLHEVSICISSTKAKSICSNYETNIHSYYTSKTETIGMIREALWSHNLDPKKFLQFKMYSLDSL